MKADAAQVARALDKPDPALRLILLYGPDESGSRALASRVDKALGADAERIDLSGSQLKGDPARLADEAASISLFGGARHIRVDPAGDEAIEAVEALLEAPSAGNLSSDFNAAVINPRAAAASSRLKRRMVTSAEGCARLRVAVR